MKPSPLWPVWVLPLAACTASTSAPAQDSAPLPVDAVLDGDVAPDGPIPDAPGAPDAGPGGDAAPTPALGQVLPVDALAQLAPDACVAYSAAHREECAVAMAARFRDGWIDAHGVQPTIGDALTAVYKGELYTLGTWGTGVAAVADETYARFFWRAMQGPDITPARLLVFLSSMQAWYQYGPGFTTLRTDYIHPPDGLLAQVTSALEDPDYQTGAVPGRPVDWANWGQGKLGFSDFIDGVVEGQAVPLVIRYCSQAGGWDYYFAILAPGQSSQSERPPSTAGDPIPGDPSCGVYIQNCPACP